MSGQTIKTLSREAFRIAERISAMEIDSIISYDELSGIAGADVQSAKRYWLERARKIAESNPDPVFTESVFGIGLRRIAGGMVADVERTSTVGRIRRATRRSARRLSKVDYDKLTDDEKRAHNIAATTMGTLALFVGRSGQLTIEKAASSTPSIDPRDTLKLFQTG